MVQTVYFIEVDGELYDGILAYKPNHDDLIGICMDMGFDRSYAFDSLDVEVERVDIGPGESGVDEFFSEEELVAIRGSFCWEKRIEDRGYKVEINPDFCFTETITLDEIDPEYKIEE